MEAKLTKVVPQHVQMPKEELLAAWMAVEKVVRSLQRMGSYYSTPDAETPLDPSKHQEMLESLDAYFTPELFWELSRAGGMLAQYLPEDEVETACEEVIQYWTAPSAAGSK